MDLITLILFIIGFVLLIAGAEVLVRGASRLAIAAGITPLVVGLTVVAYGTSAPELAVTVQASFDGQTDIAIGSVVGSNIANILLVLGVSGAVAPLAVSQRLIRWDIPVNPNLHRHLQHTCKARTIHPRYTPIRPQRKLPSSRPVNPILTLLQVTQAMRPRLRYQQHPSRSCRPPCKCNRPQPEDHKYGEG